MLRWTPRHWRWDTERDVEVVKVYPRGFALMSNGVICDRDGVATIYKAGKEVGMVAVVESLKG